MLHCRRLYTLSIFTTLVFIILGGVSVLAENINGTLALENGRVVLVDDNTQKIYPIKSMTLETQSILEKLNTGDFITGSGSTINNEIVLDTIDFVGFKKLIGYWESGRNSLYFQSFSKVFATLPYEIIAQDTGTLSYSIAPGENNSWKIFFATLSKVVMANLEFGESSITLKFFNQTESLINTMVFTKNANPPADIHVTE